MIEIIASITLITGIGLSIFIIAVYAIFWIVFKPDEHGIKEAEIVIKKIKKGKPEET